MYDKSLSFP